MPERKARKKLSRFGDDVPLYQPTIRGLIRSAREKAGMAYREKTLAQGRELGEQLGDANRIERRLERAYPHLWRASSKKIKLY